MGFKSEEGFIYFNELLYRMLRHQYGKFHMNKRMVTKELTIQYKLFNITMSIIHNSRKNDALEKFYQKVGNGVKDTVNPFLTQLYYKISFQAWHFIMT